MTNFTKFSCVLFLVLLMFTIDIKADPIQIVSGTASMSLGSQFNFSGSDGSQYIGTSIGGNSFPTTYPLAAGSIFNPTTNIFAPFGQNNMDFRGIYSNNGIVTPVIYGGTPGPYSTPASMMAFSAASFQLPSQLLPTFTMQIPFTMQGVLVAIGDCTVSMQICNQIYSNASVIGNGLATYSFYSQNGSYFLGSATYNFENTNPTPEPATLILMGTGLAGIIGYAKKRRKKQIE